MDRTVPTTAWHQIWNGKNANSKDQTFDPWASGRFSDASSLKTSFSSSFIIFLDAKAPLHSTNAFQKNINQEKRIS